MTTRYNDRDHDLTEQDYRRRSAEFGRQHGGQSQGRYRFDDRDRVNRYGNERNYPDESRGYSSWQDTERNRPYYGRSYSAWDRENDYDRFSTQNRDRDFGHYGDRFSSGRDYRSGGEGYPSERWQDDWGYAGERDRAYGSYDRSFSDDLDYTGRSRGYQQPYNYPSGIRAGGSYADRARFDYGRGQYGTWPERYYERGREYGSAGERGWWDRTADEVASWFGDKEAERRRRLDQQREYLRGRGPKGYQRSDEKIKEDVSDRLSEGYLDASGIEVEVQNTEVILKGSVYSRSDKRLAEDIAESVSGITNVENRLRVTESSLHRHSFGSSSELRTGLETTGTTSATSSGTSPAGTTTNKTGSSTSTTPTTSRGRGAGN